jgi:hypothetical protein
MTTREGATPDVSNTSERSWRVGDRLEDDRERCRQLDGEDDALARRELVGLEDVLLVLLVPRPVGRDHESVAEVHVARVLPLRQRVRVVVRDAPQAGADGEAHLDHLVEPGLVSARAEAALVFVANGVQRPAGAEHSAAPGAQEVPRHLEQPELRGVDERVDGAILVEPVGRRPGEHVEAKELAVAGLLRGALDGPDDDGVGRLAQSRESRIRVAH